MTVPRVVVLFVVAVSVAAPVSVAQPAPTSPRSISTSNEPPSTCTTLASDRIEAVETRIARIVSAVWGVTSTPPSAATAVDMALASRPSERSAASSPRTERCCHRERLSDTRRHARRALLLGKAARRWVTACRRCWGVTTFVPPRL